MFCVYYMMYYVSACKSDITGHGSNDLAMFIYLYKVTINP